MGSYRMQLMRIQLHQKPISNCWILLGGGLSFGR